MAKNTEKLKARFLERAKEAHGDRYDYSNVQYVNNRTKVSIKCKQHGFFEQRPYGHVSGKGCSECAKKRRGKGRRLSQEEFLKRAREIHGNTYDYSRTVYKTMSDKIEVICHKHGLFKQTPIQHIIKYRGCKLCSNEKRACTLKRFIIKANQKHNNKYYYTNSVYKNATTKINITCNKHGVFSQTPNNHLNGKGCPKCRLKTQTYIYSICQEMYADLVIKYNYRGLPWLRISKYGTLEIDIYIPELKLAIEYDGEQHFRPIRFGNMSKIQAEYNFEITKSRDNIKNKLISEHPEDVETLIRFNFKELPLNKKYVKSKILSALNEAV
jgi:hypothetical protein